MQRLRIWIKACGWAIGLAFLASCTGGVYREEFNFTAPFEAYTRYMILAQNPFDQGAAPNDDDALRAALDSALRTRSMTPAQRDEARPQQIVAAFNYDIAAGRRRVQTFAANEVRTWAYQLNKIGEGPDLVALEFYERQTGGLLYRVEALRGETPQDTVETLLSRYPPNTGRYRRRLQYAP